MSHIHSFVMSSAERDGFVIGEVGQWASLSSTMLQQGGEISDIVNSCSVFPSDNITLLSSSTKLVNCVALEVTLSGSVVLYEFIKAS